MLQLCQLFHSTKFITHKVHSINHNNKPTYYGFYFFLTFHCNPLFLCKSMNALWVFYICNMYLNSNLGYNARNSSSVCHGPLLGYAPLSSVHDNLLCNLGYFSTRINGHNHGWIINLRWRDRFKVLAQISCCSMGWRGSKWHRILPFQIQLTGQVL